MSEVSNKQEQGYPATALQWNWSIAEARKWFPELFCAGLCLGEAKCYKDSIDTVSRSPSRRRPMQGELCSGSVTQPCLTLCDLMNYGPPCSSVHGTFQARILEWVAISPSRASSLPRDQTHVSCGSCVGRRIPYHWATWKAPFGHYRDD